MIQMQTSSDSGRQLGRKAYDVYQSVGGSKRQYASVGDVIVVSVKEALPQSRVKNVLSWL